MPLPMALWYALGGKGLHKQGILTPPQSNFDYPRLLSAEMPVQATYWYKSAFEIDHFEVPSEGRFESTSEAWLRGPSAPPCGGVASCGVRADGLGCEV